MSILHALRTAHDLATRILSTGAGVSYVVVESATAAAIHVERRSAQHVADVLDLTVIAVREIPSIVGAAPFAAVDVDFRGVVVTLYGSAEQVTP